MVAKQVGIRKVSWGTVCCRARIIRLRFCLVQRVNRSLQSSNGGIGRSRIVHVFLDGIIESFYVVSPKKRSCLYVATPLSRKKHEPCRALVEPSSLLFAYKANGTVDEDEVGSTGKQ